MRAKEFITEQTSLDGIHDGLDVAAKTLPYTYTVDQLCRSIEKPRFL
jgi:hypothetical protein